MARYLVSYSDMPSGMTREDLRKGEVIWKQALEKYPDIRWLREYDNLSEGHSVCIFEAPTESKLREFHDTFNRMIKDSGLFPDMPETEPEVTIWQIEFEFEGSGTVYEASELERV